MAQAIVSARASNEDRCERILQVYYDRLRDIDESVQDLTNFFFTVNALFIGLVVQFVRDSFQQLLMAILGYFVSVAILCITYKGFLSWRLYHKDMRPLEESLGYDISEKYETRLKGTPGEIVRVTLVRLRFSFLFLGFWLAAIIYFVSRLSIQCHLPPLWLKALLGIVILAIIFYAPWVYFNGPVRPGVIWAVVRTTWGKEV